MKRTTATAALAAVALCTAALSALQSTAPTFQVDPLWPKPLPNHWLLGSVTGVAVDAQDHVWVVHRGYDSMTSRTEIGAATNPKTADDCCVPAPQVLEFDAAGALIGHWGGPGDKFDWPVSPGGVTVDAKGSVWITAAGPPEIPGGANATAGRAGGAAAGRGTAGAGTAAARRRHRLPQDAHVPSSEDRRVPAADRQGGTAGRRREHHRAEQAGGRERRRRRQRSVRGGRIRQSPRRRVRCGHRRVQAEMDGRRRRRRAVQDGELRQDRERRHRLRLRPRPQPRRGIRQDRQAPQERRRVDVHQGHGLGVGRCVLERSAAALPLRRRRPRSESVSSCGATHWRPSAASATAAAIPARSTASAASRSIRRATSIRARRSKGSACRSS